jgi:hypothetical protein
VRTVRLQRCVTLRICSYGRCALSKVPLDHTNYTRTRNVEYISFTPLKPRWLRHCATSRKVAGSIPDGVIGIFH